MGSGRWLRTLALLTLASLALPLPARAQEAPVPPPPAPPSPAPPAERPRRDDGRRISGRFFSNLGRNAVGVFSSDNLAPFVITAAVAGSGSLFDDQVQRYFSAERRAKWLGDSGDKLGQAYVIGPMAAVLYGAGRLSGNQRFRDATYDIAQVTLVAVSYTTVLKYATQRERPDLSNNQSFPSGHTSNAFAWATVGAHYYGWKVGVPGFLVASLIGVSRLEKNAHHLSDVLAGAGLGYIVGRTAVRRDSEAIPGRPRVGLSPATDRQGRGTGLLVSVGF